MPSACLVGFDVALQGRHPSLVTLRGASSRFAAHPLKKPPPLKSLQSGPRGPKMRLQGFQDSSRGPRRPPRGLQDDPRWLARPLRWHKRSPRRPKRPPRRLQTGLGRPKSLKNLWFFNDFHDSSLWRHGGSKRGQDGSRTAQDGLKTASRRAKTAPRRLQEGFREAQDGPRGAPEGPKRAPGGRVHDPRQFSFQSELERVVNSTSRRSQEGLREALDGPRGAQERANRAPRGSRITLGRVSILHAALLRRHGGGFAAGSWISRALSWERKTRNARGLCQSKRGAPSRTRPLPLRSAHPLAA